MSSVDTIVTTIGGISVAMAILGWVARSVFVHLLDKDIEAFKLRISAENDSKIEKLKHELEKISNEHRVKFESLHARRNEVIESLYMHLVGFQKAVNKYVEYAVSLEDINQDKLKLDLWKKVDAFKNYTEKHRIFFPDEICERLDHLFEITDKPVSNLMMAVEYQDLDKEASEKLIELWIEADEIMETDVVEMRKALEKDFRGLLGVNS